MDSFKSAFISKLFKKKNDKQIALGNHSDVKYSIGEHVITIPNTHALPKYQAHHKLYDRFLPVLAKYLNPEGIVIDIGANVGDSTIAMLDYCKNNFYCVEPSSDFYPYLELNFNMLPQALSKRLTCFKTFIGSRNIKGELIHQNGTARVQSNIESINIDYLPLDNLISADNKFISLIKVDTDGFDYDVLLSGQNVISEDKPILFWENQMFESFQKEGFIRLYEFLIQEGYKHIYVFDNFGNLLLEKTDFENIKSVNSYIESIDNLNLTRTFYYTDILASTNKYSSSLESAIFEYKKKYLSL